LRQTAPKEETVMNYLGFAGWLFFLTWIVADTIPRYVLPSLHSVYDALEELDAGAWGTGRLGAPLSLLIQAVLSAFLAYVLTTWSTWCVLRCIVYTQTLESGKSFYFITGFLCCEYALGKMAKADRHRGFFMSVFHFVMAMGAFVVFAMNPAPIKTAFPWLLRLMDIDL
jgi:hypothetical protein